MGVELATDRPGFYEMVDVDVSDSELVYHVRDALKSVSQGDSDHYNQLIAVMHYTGRLAPDEVAMLVTSLKALSGSISYIDIIHHESLLSSIFGMSMWNYGPDVMDALVELIISLAASNGKFVDSCLDMLVRNFTPPKSYLDLLGHPRGLARKHEVLDRVHSALSHIADLVPLAPMRLTPIILQRMPHMFDKETLIVIYVESMLRLESSALGEFVGSTMLMALVDRLIDLDVEISWDDIVLEDSGKGIFDMELEDVDDIIGYAEKDGFEHPRGTLGRQSLGTNAVADKLDSLMVLACEHLKSCADGERLTKVFETLLQSFWVTILNAYKSKFSQFVMFYACSLDPEHCGERFAVFLADIFVCRTHPALTRMSAVAYLASYLSRGKFLPPSLIASTLKRLVDWCLEYCQVQNGEEKTLYPETHRVFYSGCQAIMYVLCFRMRSMMDSHRLKSQLLHMPLEPIFRHQLDPLKVCLPSIVEEFLRQAKAAHLFTVSETFLFNNLLESDLSKAFGGMERLDMFFPFDPCLLKKCDRFIRPSFVYWSMVKTTYDEGEDCSSEEDINEYFDGNGKSYMDGGITRSLDEHDLDLDEFECQLNKMSITPRNSLKNGLINKLENYMRMPARIRPSTSPESL
ncbi:PREDICTED: RNA polymerase I-specific transcription initiation factor RRN3-like [Nelumbo nucifera]|uniref:RNA polymerase I-specific transcription initiation factor RRN3-like n=1 Tax=Nelumbo nucifera TaxID=4432 RepID=A0A1U8B9V8_NELNU|nr:PREDICTED: RNA polymerase I-specific transcription initiation factor RRN3-like [Nelumbo nucifera]XP_010272855.1 PREDICTED: RNA polymerase I-specific transcription initiation factor RRN3-like [Nelumbo nucifera]